MLLKALGNMTSFASPPECAAMCVVGAMAAKAGRRRGNFNRVLRGVTGVAQQSLVGDVSANLVSLS